MPCDPLIINGQVVGFICSRSRSKKTPCYKCGKPATKLCDFRNYETLRYKDDYGRKKVFEIASIDTCDRPMCAKCSNNAGGDIDFCDEHDTAFHRAITEKAEILYQERIRKFEQEV